MAGFVLISILITLIALESVNKSMIDQNFVHVPSPLQIIRSSDETTDNDAIRVKAYSLYEDKAYRQAAPLLFQYHKVTGDIYSPYFAGLSYLASYELRKAQSCLEHPVLAQSGWEAEQYLRLINEAGK